MKNLLTVLIAVCVFLSSTIPAPCVEPRLSAEGPFGVDAGAVGVKPGGAVSGKSVWMGSHGAAVWYQVKLGVWSIVGRAFAADGSPIGEIVTLVPVVNLRSSSETMGLTFCQGELLLFWLEAKNSSQNDRIMAQRMNTDFVMKDPAPLLLHENPPDIAIRSVQGAGSHAVHLIAYDRGAGNLTAVRVGAFPAAPESMAVSSSLGSIAEYSSFRIAANGDDFLAVWTASSTVPYQMEARSISASGVPGPVSQAAPGIDVRVPFVLAALGEGYALAWNRYVSAEPAEAFGQDLQRLTAAGAPAGAVQTLFDNINSASLFLSSSSGGLIAGTYAGEGTALGRRYKLRHVAPGGTMGPVQELEDGRMIPRQVHQVGGGAALVIGSGFMDGSEVAMLARPLHGDLTSAGPVQMLNSGVPPAQAPVVACRGTEYLVVWQDERAVFAEYSNIRGRFIALDGAPLGSSFVISATLNHETSPAVAVSGGQYLVSWSSEGGVFGSFVSGPESGAVVSPRFQLNDDSYGRGVAVSGGGDGGFFAVWREDTQTSTVRRRDLYGAWISATGTVQPAGGFYLGEGRAVSVAGGGDSYGLVWRKGEVIYSATVPGLPPASPSAPVSQSWGQGHAPEICWNGTSYQLIWRVSAFQPLLTASMSESGGVVSMGRPVGSGYSQNPLEPVILPATGGGWQALWLDNVAVAPVHRYRIAYAALDSAGVQGLTEFFAPRSMEGTNLSAARGPDGSVLVVYAMNVSPDEPERVGGLEYILLHPDRPPVAPPALAMTLSSESVTLQWPLSPYFPPDASLVRGSLDLEQWYPLSNWSNSIPEVIGDQVQLRYAQPPFSRCYFRLVSELPGNP